MAFSFNGTTQDLTIPASLLSGAVPVAMSAMVYPKTETNARYAIYLRGAGSSFDNIFALGYGFPASKKAVWVQRGQNQASFPSVNSVADVTQNEWNHILGQSINLSSHQVWLNGTKATSTTTGLSIASGSFTIGRIGSFSGGGFFNGHIAEVGLWDTSLTDEEVISLSKGITPDKIRPQNLIFYAPLIRNLQDVCDGSSITNNNGATVADHPRVYA